MFILMEFLKKVKDLMLQYFYFLVLPIQSDISHFDQLSIQFLYDYSFIMSLFLLARNKPHYLVRSFL